MMVHTLDQGQRTARKTYRCGMCGIAIKPGDGYNFSVNIYDAGPYTWRDCLACARDRICAYVYDWAGYPDEGVCIDQATEWADEAVGWPAHWYWTGRDRGRPIHPAERLAARNYLARLAGGEGE